MAVTAPADRCPACGTERNAPPVEPYSVREFKGSLTARYRCPRCPCKWLVGWLISALELDERKSA
jgi:transposase-like protein